MEDEWGDWAAPEQVAAAPAQPLQQPGQTLQKPARPALDEFLFSSGAGDGVQESDDFGGFEAAPAPPPPLPSQRPAQQPQATCQQRSALAKGDPAWYLDGRSGAPQWVEAKVGHCCAWPICVPLPSVLLQHACLALCYKSTSAASSCMEPFSVTALQGGSAHSCCFVRPRPPPCAAADATLFHPFQFETAAGGVS